MEQNRGAIGTVSQGIASAVASHQGGPGWNRPAGWNLSMWSMHVLPMLAWIFSSYSDFLPQSFASGPMKTGMSSSPQTTTLNWTGSRKRMDVHT